jgi:hypothetical protein
MKKKKTTIAVYEEDTGRVFNIQTDLQKEKRKRITQPETVKHILNKYEEAN